MQSPFLIGTTVYLRPLEADDARTVQPWFNDPEVLCFLARCRPMTLAEGPDNVALGVAVRATDKLIGTAGLHQFDHRARQTAFGISLGDKAAWGHGYGSEATPNLTKYGCTSGQRGCHWLRSPTGASIISLS